MAEAEDKLLSLQVTRQIRVSRFLRGLQRRIREQIDELFEVVITGVRRSDPGKATSKTQVDRIIDQAQRTTNQLFDAVEKRLLAELRNFADDEAEWQTQASARTLDKEEAESLRPVTGRQLWREFLNAPFDGFTFAEWMDDIRRSITDGLAKEIRAGWANGETTDEIISRLV